MRNVIKTNSLMYKKEKRILGYTHAEVGRLLALKWKLTDKIVNMISYHHRPFLSDNYKKECAIVNFGDIIIRALKIGSGGDEQIPLIEENVFSTLGLNEEKIASLMYEIEQKYNETKDLFNIK